MNKKLMIAMVVVGMSALYVRFQVVGMEKGDRVEQERQRLERERVAAEVPENVERDTEGFYGFYKPKDETDEEAEKKALALNMRHENFPEEMREEVLSNVLFPAKVMAFLCHKLCIPVQMSSHSDEVKSVAFSPDGKLLATGSEDGTAEIWNVASGNRLKRLFPNKDVNSVAFSPDGKLLATGEIDGTARIWDVATGQRLQKLQCDRNVNSVAFSPDGKLLATGSVGGTAGIWDVASGNRVQTLQCGSRWVSSVTFSPDGKLLATGCEDGTAGIWNVASGNRLKTLSDNDEAISSVAFSPDGKLLATGSWDGTAGIWNVESGNRLKRLLSHSDEVSSVTFSPDGKLLVATESEDGRVDIWDATSGKKLQTFQHAGVVNSVAFSPDGKLLAIANGRVVFLRNMECFQTLITTAAQYKLMEAFDLVLQGQRNGIVRIVGKINATPEQWATFETLPTNIQTALRSLIRNEGEQKNVEDSHSKQKAAAAPAISSGKEEEEE